MIISSPRFHSRAAACAAALLAVCACQNVPKYKRSNGKFAEWTTYEGKHFYPSNGSVKAIDTQANTVTIAQGSDSKVYQVAPTTRIIHEGTDIPLAQLPLNQGIKFTLSQDGKQLLTIWYGQHTFQYVRPGAARKKQQSQIQ